MTVHHRLAVAIGLTCSFATAGCGLGAGPSIGPVSLTVTRDYGSDRLLQRSDDDASESETAMRLLDRNAEISTRYGGGFVRGIDGLEGGRREGRFFDWFFYVNGVESPVGAADYALHGADRVWWDYRDWTAAMRVPAVVGSFPEPFLHGYEGKRHPVGVRCLAAGPACRVVRSRLLAAGVSESGGGGGEIRVLVGSWPRLRRDAAAALIERGPASSGVFADFEPGPDGYTLQVLDETGDPAAGFGDGAGMVAATREGNSPPTWLVTGTDRRGISLAARALDASDLRDRYAIAVAAHRTIPLPF